jgi:predicted nucleotidyltransferase
MPRNLADSASDALTKQIGDGSISLGAIRRWPSKKARDWARRYAALATSSGRVDAIVAIGSAVRGKVHEKSDLDLVVIFHGEAPPLTDAPIDVDVRQFVRDEVEQLLASGHDLLGWAVRYGVPVLDRGGYWASLVCRWRERLHLPSAAIAEERSRRAERTARELLASGDDEAALEMAVAALTHRARARLISAGVYPASRLELPEQLRDIGELELGERLLAALNRGATAQALLGRAIGYSPRAGRVPKKAHA